MSGLFAVDFGTSNTVLSIWDSEKHEAVPYHLEKYGKEVWQGSEKTSIIPSVIHYAEDGRQWIGQQVHSQGLYHSKRTMRWMKRYISHRSPLQIKFDDKLVTPASAGEDFLTGILGLASREAGIAQDEVVFTVPVESFEHYEEWLAEVAATSGIPGLRLIDEPSAAALGYGTHIQPGNIYLIFDFGGGTMHAAVVLMDDDPSAASGRRCRVLGKAGKYLGGTTIDQWIFHEVLQINGHKDYEDEVKSISNTLLTICEKAKEELTFADTTEINLNDPITGINFSTRVSRYEFESILERNDLYATVNQTIQKAIQNARERGYDESIIHSALMVGGSSVIPSVQRAVRQIFGADRVFFNRPFDAVARGAAAFAAGVDFYDNIQHNYAIRYSNPQSGEYEYRTIINKGTPYPSPDVVSRLSIKSAFDGQKILGIAIFEMTDSPSQTRNDVELVFDPSGAARLIQLTPQEAIDRRLFWMNEQNLTFLHADPPGLQGEPRFEVNFRIDYNKRLILSARDLKTGHWVLIDQPVVKLK